MNGFDRSDAWVSSTCQFIGAMDLLGNPVQLVMGMGNGVLEVSDNQGI